MQEHYPLTERLWLEWLQDEIASTITTKGTDHVERLFQKAVKDYLSVPIWRGYIE